jgi:WD40 repeat protein
VAAKESDRPADVTATESWPKPGREDEALAGSLRNYRVEGEHARGGLGLVLRAWDKTLNRTVAIKQLLTLSHDHQRRFAREVQITARLQHPNIVPVYESGNSTSGTPFYAMKFVSGRTLRELISERHSLDERLALLPNVLAIADAIAYAHSQNVVHRDLKPSNVLVGSFGETVVVDWGLAKDVRERGVDAPAVDAGHPHRLVAEGGTIAGTVLGTPSYMAPEQARGDDVDTLADVYALGSLIYHVLSGQPPYSGESSTDIVAQVLAGPPPPLESREPSVPKDLAAIVHKAMEREPDLRYASAEQLAADLRRFQTGQLVGARQYSRTVLVQRWARKHRPVLSVALILVLLLATSTVLFIRRIVHERDRATTERALAQRRADDLVLTQAQTLLMSDPTATIAWLQRYPQAGPRQDDVHAIAADAVSRGVAEYVLDLDRAAYANAMSPDGREVASGGDDGYLRTWQLPSGATRMLPFPQPLAQLAYSPDGRFFAAAGDEGALAVWDRVNGTRRELAGHHEDLLQIAFAPDGNALLSRDAANVVYWWDLRASSNRRLALAGASAARIDFAAEGQPLALVAVGSTVEVWDARSGQRIAQLPHAGTVEALEYDGGAGRLVTLSRGRLVAWELRSRRVLRQLPIDKAPLGLRLSADGTRVALWSNEQSLTVWQLDTGATRSIHFPQQINLARFSPDGSVVAIGGLGGEIDLWDLNADAVQPLLGHGDKVADLHFSSDGKRLISSGLNDRMVRVWPLQRATVRRLTAQGDPLAHFSFSPAGDRVGAASDNGRTYVWGISPGVPSLVLPHDRPSASEAFSPSGRRIAVANTDRTTEWRDLDSGAGGKIAQSGHPRCVLWIDEDTIATATDDGTLSIWSLEMDSGQTVAAHDGAISTLLLSPNRQSLLSTGDDGVIRLDDLRSHKPHIVGKHERPVDRALFWGDAEHIAAIDRKGSLRIWDVRSGQARLLRERGPSLLSLAVLPAAGLLAVGSRKGDIEVWSVAGGQPLRLRGHQGIVRDLAFSPDGRLLASAGHDHTVRLWNPRTGDRAMLRGHQSLVVAVAFSPHGELLGTASSDATVRLWSTADVSLLPANDRDFRDWLMHATNLLLPPTEASPATN